MCPVHVFIEHFAMLNHRFGNQAGSLPEDMPLFPTICGGPATKHLAVSGIEAVAVRTGESLTTPDGTRRFGGHTLRVTGARHLAATGVDLLTLQVLARWDSEIILRYVADAPLEQLTSRYLQKLAEADLETSLEKLRTDVGAMREAVSLIPAWSRDDLAREIELHVRGNRARDAPSVGRLLVRNEVTKVVHRADADEGSWPEGSRSAACGWKYGLSNRYCHVTDLPEDSKMVCYRCLPVERLGMMGIASDSST